MNILEIPFTKKVGIEKNQNSELQLPFTKSIQNHLETIHASAQFCLAETASGEALQTVFPDLVGKVVPVLRSADIKFKKPASNSVTAFASITDDVILKFNEQFAKKGRSTIQVKVEVKNEENMVTCIGSFNWFVQGI